MKISGPLVLLVTIAVVIGSRGRAAAEVREKDPASASSGNVYEWKAENGLAYHYRIPKRYDKAAGANLTFILHGSNLTRSWGFANHKPNTFRPDDIVVCPDGTTSNGQGGYNFLGKNADVDRLHSLHLELKKLFKVNATFLYGHSQGSFFALHYAGEKPNEVQGVVAHASGVWTWTKQPAAAHHQAIVFMHGTQDPVVPYGQSVGGYESFTKQKYPNVRLRTLEGWNHWPAEHNGPTPHTSQQLAWAEGMTSNDPKRQAAAFKHLSTATNKDQHDYAALYSLAVRIAKVPNATAGAIRASDRAIKAVDALVERHLDQLSEIDPNGEIALSDEAWIGHLPMFFRAFGGMPKSDALRNKWAEVLRQQRDTGNKHLRAYHSALRAGNKAAAFSSGIQALKSGFLTVNCADTRFLSNLKAWAGDSRALKLGRAEVSEFKKLHKDFEKAIEAGKKEFEAINGKASLLKSPLASAPERT